MKNKTVLIMLLGTISQAHAATVYSYEGNSYNAGYNVPESGNAVTSVQDTSKYGAQLTAQVTIDFNVSNSFTGLLTSYDSAVSGTNHISSWDISSGTYSLSNTNSSPYSYVNVFFNAGKITGWGLVGYSYDRSSLVLESYTGDGAADFISYSNGDIQNVVRDAPGMWTEVSAVPLPSSALLFCSAFAVLGLLNRRRAESPRCTMHP